MMKFKINEQFLLDLSISGFFTIFSMTIIRFIIPDGLTSDFLFKGSKIVSLIFIILSIIFLIYWFFSKPLKFKKKISLPNFKDFILLALPMSPVIDFALINIEYLNLNGLFYLMGVTLIFSIFFSFVVPIFFSYFASYNILMIAGLALCFTILTMAKISHNPNDHILNSQFVTQGMYLIISFAVLYLLYIFNKKIAYTVAIFFMITGIIVNFLNLHLNNSTKVLKQKTSKIEKFIKNNNNKIIKKKNIYILVYESYANLETLNYYGFDNNNQINDQSDLINRKKAEVHDGFLKLLSEYADMKSKTCVEEAQKQYSHKIMALAEDYQKIVGDEIQLQIDGEINN